MVLATAVLFPIGLLASAKMDQRIKAYTFWFLMLEGAILGIFLSLDLIAFFIFWEAMLVPMYFIIAGWGSSNRKYAATKFFVYTAAGSAFLLAAMIALAFLHQSATGVLTFDYRVLAPVDGLADGAVDLHRVLVVLRLHGRVRDQGAAGPVPHLAARTCTPRHRPPVRWCWPA